MLSLCCQPGVGIVGAKLLYPDGTVQHAGVVTGLGGFAGHSHKYARGDGSGYMFRLATVQDFSCVTAACLLCRAGVYDAVGGLDEGFAVAFNDVDFCLRVRKAGWRVVYTPYAQLTHYESKSRGLDEKGEAKRRFDGERARLEARYTRAALTRDPYYNPAPHARPGGLFRERRAAALRGAGMCGAAREEKRAAACAEKCAALREEKRAARRAAALRASALPPEAMARGRPCDGENAVRAGRVEARRGRVLLCLRRARAGHLAHSAPRPRRGASACACRCARAAR